MGLTYTRCRYHCDDKVLKVTQNLVAALKRLRLKTNGSSRIGPVNSTISTRRAFVLRRAAPFRWRMRRVMKVNIKRQDIAFERPAYLWIDAICINQEDLDERSQQVKLMPQIYSKVARVIVWLGEEMPRTREGCNLMVRFVNYIRADLSVVLDEFTKGMYVEDLIPSLEAIADWVITDEISFREFETHPAYPAVWDFFASRTFFERLWTVQEMSLPSPDAIMVLCGSVSMGLLPFTKITFLVYLCFRLKLHTKQQGNESALIASVCRIYLQATLTERRELWWEMMATRALICLNPLDRIFAVLGLLNKDKRHRFKDCSYGNPNAVFRTAAEIFLEELESVEHLEWKDFVCPPTSRFEFPTWVVLLGYQNTRNLLVYNGLKTLSSLQRTQCDPRIQGDILYAQGIVFDSVIRVTKNFSPEFPEDQLLGAHYLAQDVCSTSHTLFGSQIRRLWMVHDFVSTLFKNSLLDQESYDSMIMALGEKETSRSTGKVTTSSSYPELQDVGNLHRNVDTGYVNKIKYTARELVRRLLKWNQDPEIDGKDGRNIFVTCKGYIGKGPFGSNYPRSEPAVQVGDIIAIFPRLDRPLVLRPFGTGSHKFVGPANIPEIDEDPWLHSEDQLPFEEIRIV